MGGEHLGNEPEPEPEPEPVERISAEEIKTHSETLVRQLSHVAFAGTMPSRGGGHRSGHIAHRKGKIRTKVTTKMVERSCSCTPVREAMLAMLQEKAGNDLLDELFADMQAMRPSGEYSFGNKKW